jgi:hypothetical protein
MTTPRERVRQSIHDYLHEQEVAAAKHVDELVQITTWSADAASRRAARDELEAARREVQRIRRARKRLNDS